MPLSRSEELQRLFDSDFFSQDYRIRQDLHLTTTWADAFWRRRQRLASRIDPELEYLAEFFQQNKIHVDNLLEIGSGYGRVTIKLAALEQVKQVTGVEICPHLKHHAEQYIGQNRSDEKDGTPISFVFDDVFSATQLGPGSFDLVVIPMNTVPSFSPDDLEDLFGRVHQLLQPGGMLVFTTYKEITNFTSGEKYGGELLVELGEVPLAAEFFTLADQNLPWGIQSITYHRYSFLDETYPDDSIVFRTGRYSMQHHKLRHLLEAHQFGKVETRDISHSSVWVVRKVESLE